MSVVNQKVSCLRVYFDALSLCHIEPHISISWQSDLDRMGPSPIRTVEPCSLGKELVCTGSRRPAQGCSVRPGTVSLTGPNWASATDPEPISNTGQTNRPDPVGGRPLADRWETDGRPTVRVRPWEGWC